MKKLYIVYRIHNIETDMDYIGYSMNPINRIFEQHEKSNSYIGNAICLYGWDTFDVSILHLVKIKEEACRLEVEEIKNHNCQAPNGYNMTSGGDGGATFSGRHHTKETKKKIKKANAGYKHSEKTKEKMKGIKKPGTSKAMKEKERSKETIEKMRKSLTGRKRSSTSILKQRRTKLRNRLVKLEQEIKLEKVGD